MKTITLVFALVTTSLMAFSQKGTTVNVSSANTNVSVGSTTTSHSTTTFQPTRDQSNSYHNTNSNSNDNSNSNSNSNSNYSNNNSYNNNSNNYGNSNYNNNSYSNNGYNSYNNGYGNNNYYNNNSYSNNNSQKSYKSTDNSYGEKVITQDAGLAKIEKSDYNIPNQFSNYRKNTAIDKFFSNNQKTTQTFIINAQTDNTVKGTGGTIVKIAANSFVTPEGEVVKGDVEFQLKEMYDKSDMILSNAHTISNDKPLVSGGEVFMGAEKNGQAVILANDKPISLEIPAPAGSTEPMQLFNGQPNRNTVNWNLASSNSVTPVLNSNSSTGQSYNFTSSSMNWLNCDQFMRNDRNSNNANTKVVVNVPRQYDTTNTAVFLVFAGQKTVTKFDNYIQADNLLRQTSTFDTKWYSVPTGSDVTIVAISEINGEYYSSFQRTTLMQNHYADLTFTPTTLDDFKQNMEKLP